MAQAAVRDIGRLTRSEDFERVLRSAPRSRSAHFAIHHVATMPTRPGKRRREPLGPELSTIDDPIRVNTVDDLRGEAPFQPSARGLEAVSGVPSHVWLGLVVPKRHARRAVTRNLLRREIRAAVAARWTTLPRGMWVVRLRAGFDRDRFRSAASKALRQTARLELESLVERCVEPSLDPADLILAERS